jgi:hypothetical protein
MPDQGMVCRDRAAATPAYMTAYMTDHGMVCRGHARSWHVLSWPCQIMAWFVVTEPRPPRSASAGCARVTRVTTIAAASACARGACTSGDGQMCTQGEGQMCTCGDAHEAARARTRLRRHECADAAGDKCVHAATHTVTCGDMHKDEFEAACARTQLRRHAQGRACTCGDAANQGRAMPGGMRVYSVAVRRQ